MDKLIFEILNNYYAAVSKTGYIPFKSVEKILILDFLSDLIDYENEISCEDRYLISKLYNCIIENNCLT